MARSPESDLISDLQYLRKGEGPTLRRLRQAAAIVRACGGADQPLETVRERLYSALRSLPAGRERDALTAAFGAPSEETPLLKARRERYAASINRKPYTVAEYEDRALAELALRLLSYYYSGSMTPEQMHIPHGGFLLQKLKIETHMLDLRWVKSKQARLIVSLVDGAQGFKYGSYSPTVLQDLQGCKLGETRRGLEGVVHELHFPRALKRGESHSFSFTDMAEQSASDEEPPESDVAGQTFETPTLSYVQEVYFEGVLPQYIWSYDKLSRIERPGEKRQEYRDHRVMMHFSDLYGGLASGIAWHK